MALYTEPVVRAANTKGKARLTTVLGHLPGAVGHGFDGNGTPSRRGQPEEGRRIWRFETPLDVLPQGVIEITEAQYAAISAIRKATRPVPRPPSQDELDSAARRKRLQATANNPATDPVLLDLLAEAGFEPSP